MPTLEINGAKIYFETYGVDHPGRAPIVLIHGSTNTGRSDWELIAPLLAREYRVIVPDCRGHGQSTNPRHSYSFKEMAADTAALVRALGYPRAHIIGHSNGGNVAVVILVEHPEIVQTCIPQAANAFVSPDLVEKEPPIFDPDRVAREDPSWMNFIIATTSAVHGEDYWRDLLLLTVKEIVSEPNYTPEILAQVQRPTLVIQGENDRVNAPAHHAQFIAKNIPDAELWIPVGVGHNVHFERLTEWVDHVLDFLARRGDEANDTLYRLRRARYASDRETIFEVKLNGGGNLIGRVLTADQLQAALDVLPVRPAAEQVQVLLTEATPWALVTRSITDLRAMPTIHSERMSQVLLGETVRVLDTRGEWAFIRLEKDGYLGWVQSVALKVCTRSEAEAYRAACEAMVVAEIATAYYDITQLNTPRTVAGDGNWAEEDGKLPFGVALPVIQRRNMRSALRLPDGSVWWVPDADLLPFKDRPRADAEGVARTLALIRRFIGVPYLWGGRTPFGFDCSGLAQAFYGFMGVNIPRDADQQYRAGAPVVGAPQPGDLLYFGEAREEARRAITHVAISLGGDEMIHSNGAAWGVSYNSLNPESPLYRAWLRENLVGVRRFQ